MDALSLTNPLVMGALITAGMKLLPKFVGPLLKKVDDGKLMDKYASVLHPLSLGLVFLASMIQSGLSGHLADLNWDQINNFVMVYLPALVGAKAMDTPNSAKIELKK